MSLDTAKILELLKTDAAPKYERPAQVGPLRFMEQTGKCGSRGCACQTHYQLCGVWYCGVHALDLLNRMTVLLIGEGKGWRKAFFAAKEQVEQERKGWVTGLTTGTESVRVSA